MSDDTGAWPGWRAAAERALYGPSGFFVREAPADHFRTSAHVSPLFAAAVAELLVRVDRALGRPAELALVDVGAGRGELLRGVLTSVPPEVAARLRPHAVERAPRPAGLDPRVRWDASLPAPGSVTGLLFANEWLDNVPLDVVEVDAAGVVREVLVRPADGRERLGPPVGGPAAGWLRRWWPLSAEPGLRAEIGASRDAAWAGAVGCLRAGLAVAVDYAHDRETRPPFGTLTGFRGGRQVRPVPDGSCDLTAHVALDACAAACAPRARTDGPEPRAPAGGAARDGESSGWGEEAAPGGGTTGPDGTAYGKAGPAHAPAVGVTRTDGDTDRTTGADVEAAPDAEPTGPVGPAHAPAAGPARTDGDTDGDTDGQAEDGGAMLLTQREALRALGVTGRRPPVSLAGADPAAYVRALSAAGEAAELTDPAGLGAFGWLVQPVRVSPAEFGLRDR